MNILRWKRKSKNKIRLKTLILFIFSLIMTTFAWFAYSKVLNTNLNLHIASWDMEYYIGAVKKENPIAIGIDTLYPTMQEQVITIDIKNNGEKLVDIVYNVQSVTIAGVSYELVQEGEQNTTANYIILTPTAIETDTATSKQVVKGVITNDITKFPFTIEVEHSPQVVAGGQGYLTVRVNWIGDNSELDSEWGYIVGEYFENNPTATSAMTIQLSIDSYQANGPLEVTTGTLPSTAETKPYLPTGFSRVVGTSLETGLVIKDGSGNEYVWVEVPKNETVYTSAGLGITEFTDAECETIENYLKTYTGTYRNSTAYVDEHYLYQAVGMAKEDYDILKNNMLKSIYQNGGFYIGRYETGIANTYRTASGTPTETPVIKSNAYPFNYVTCSQAQSLASRMESGQYTSSLLFGIQWDLALKYIETKGAAIPEELNSSSLSCGNYYESTYDITNTKAKYYISSQSWLESRYSKKTSSSVLLSTGASSIFSKQNISDLAGNLYEWTLEYTSTPNSPCSLRGGNFDNGYGLPASGRSSNSTSYSSNTAGFRVAIY